MPYSTGMDTTRMDATLDLLTPEEFADALPRIDDLDLGNTILDLDWAGGLSRAGDCPLTQTLRPLGCLAFAL